MFFSQLLERLQKAAGKQSTKKEATISSATSPSTKKATQISSRSGENINPKKQLNRALENINNAIQSNGANSHLLLDKAEILIHKEKYKQASQTLNQIPRRYNGSKISKRANQLLSLVQQLQQEAATKKTVDLLHNLRKTATKYQQNPSNFPSPESPHSNSDITQFVRQEARRAQTNGLPNFSCELIGLTLEAGHQSPWLLYEKAVSISMMGRQKEALRILDKLQKEGKGEKLSKSAEKKSENLKKNRKQDQLKLKSCLAKESELIAIGKGIRAEFLPKPKNIDSKTNIKSLVFKRARASLVKFPEATHDLCSLILGYFPSDLASLQLKGEALAALQQNDEATRIWRDLAHSGNAKISQKATELIAENLAARAEIISKTKSPKAALSFFIKEHFMLNLAPILNKKISKILSKAERLQSEPLGPELQKHQLQLIFNTLVIEHLENHWRHKGRLIATAAAQKPGTIRKTGLKAG